MIHRAAVRGCRSGQALAEYAVVLGVLLASALMIALFLYAFREYGGRILDLVAADFP